MRVALLALAVALLAGGCGDDGESGGLAPEEARTTRVEVIERTGANVGFDPETIYAREAPGVVTVFAVFGGGGVLRQGDGQQGVGSGFLLNADGEVATNAHVVTQGEGGDIRRAEQVFVQFADRNQVEAKIVGFDPNSDVALLRIEPAGLTLRPLPLGRSRDVVVGEPVAAIGSPYGEPQSLSVGVVSARDRSIQSLTGFVIPGALQTDAAINRGNSGGPLVDARGDVLGINSQIRSTGGGGEGVGYAVPVDIVRRVTGELRKDGRVDYAYLGVETAPLYPQLARRFDLPVTAGAWVQEVSGDGPAADAGVSGGGGGEQRFQAQAYRVGGDVITRLDDLPLREPDDLSERLTRYQPGQRVRLELFRGDERREIEVRLGKRPASSSP
ncbi:MAG: trypsin-like peptidase domain-containing protein [Solirubrobacterales bacterium]|nr:trypsin-like peptidase domain-containing protein [Solirubrobacterales bacterium]